ncbi:MAG: exosortase/archaeosortase family protein [Gemmataceae bacterium]|nr:exosortase-associated EpsI family protein [Gemmata sp.]MDW8199173.1 exosortase/archaeosortase family protein [Gemmataceae bacterium]
MSRSASPAATSATIPSPAAAPWTDWLVLAAGIAAVAGLFADSFRQLLTLWSRDQNYSHGYLVIPISLALALHIRYGRRGVGPPLRGEPVWGLVSITLGVFLQLVVGILRWPILSYLGLVCVVRGLLTSAGGRAWASAFNFPLVFLFFMFPAPVKWTSYAAIWLQDIVSRVSESVLSLFFVVHRVGHSIRIAGVDSSLVVAEECSGLGQIVCFLAFAVLMGHLFGRPMWFRVALVLASVPVAIVANTLRVVLMNVAAVYFGTKWLGGTLHDAPILFSLPVGIVLFFLIDRALESLLPPPRRITNEPESPTTPDIAHNSDQGPHESGTSATVAPGIAIPTPSALGQARFSSSTRRGMVVATLGMIVGIGLQWALYEHLQVAGEASYPTLVRPLDTLPLTIIDPKTNEPAWIGKDNTGYREKLVEKLPFPVDDLLVRVYQNADGELAHVYMVYSRAGEDRKHHPEICIRDVNGSPEDLSFRRRVPLGPEGVQAQRFRFQKGVGRVTVVYYWHYTLVPAPQPGLTRWQQWHQRIGITAPSITAQVSLGSDDPRTIAAVEQQLLPQLHAAAQQGVLPPQTQTGCERLPIALARE